jgi:hypothetical protein
VIGGILPSEVFVRCSLPEALLVLRRNDRKEAIAAFDAAWSRFIAGKAKWCTKAAKELQRYQEQLKTAIDGRARNVKSTARDMDRFFARNPLPVDPAPTKSNG